MSTEICVDKSKLESQLYETKLFLESEGTGVINRALEGEKKSKIHYIAMKSD